MRVRCASKKFKQLQQFCRVLASHSRRKWWVASYNSPRSQFVHRDTRPIGHVGDPPPLASSLQMIKREPGHPDHVWGNPAQHRVLQKRRRFKEKNRRKSRGTGMIPVEFEWALMQIITRNTAHDSKHAISSEKFIFTGEGPTPPPTKLGSAPESPRIAAKFKPIYTIFQHHRITNKLQLLL